FIFYPYALLFTLIYLFPGYNKRTVNAYKSGRRQQGLRFVHCQARVYGFSGSYDLHVVTAAFGIPYLIQFYPYMIIAAFNKYGGRTGSCCVGILSQLILLISLIACLYKTCL